MTRDNNIDQRKCHQIGSEMEMEKFLHVSSAQRTAAQVIISVKAYDG